MAEPLKNLYTREVVAALGAAVARVDRRFDTAAFEAAVFDHAWSQRELKDRMHHIARLLYTGMAGDYEQRITRLMRICPPFRGLPYLLFPDIVEQFGLDRWDISMRALETFTPLCSSEFAIRPFIRRDPVRAMKQLRAWSKSTNEHVRRLSSEGCRPRLPWAMALPEFQRDPTPVLPILETLRTDPSEYVRRSVANNLNDIAKDHPAIVLGIARRWLKEKPETHKLVKHACRTLLKRGDAEALALFGFADDPALVVRRLALASTRLVLGEALAFSFEVHNGAGDDEPVRIEYAIDYRKARGHHHRKVFKISERPIAPRETIARRHPLRNLTTRTHHPGEHRLHVILNGTVKASAVFELLA